MEFAGRAAVRVHVSGLRSVIKVKTDDRDAALDAPGHCVIAKTGRARHPFGEPSYSLLMSVRSSRRSPAWNSDPTLFSRSSPTIASFEPRWRTSATMAGPTKAGDLQIVDILATFHHVRWRIDMRAGMQAHMNAANDLAESAIGIILDDLGLELHVLRKPSYVRMRNLLASSSRLMSMILAARPRRTAMSAGCAPSWRVEIISFMAFYSQCCANTQ